jgi:ABC-2 type transport system ATP-binding protein
MIKINNLTKTFKVHKKEAGFKASIKSLINRKYIEKNAINNFSLEIKSGEIIGLIGSNGAGKTTLTKVLAGIIHPSSGEVSVNGHNPWERNNEYRKQMALIMGQKAQLWWDLPAADGFLLLKEIYKIPEDDYHEMIDYLSECLMIKDQLNIQVRRLSLGERMKVELMAALLHRPKIIYLDEPTIGLDLSAQKAVRKFLKEYREKYNPTIILTSHYMDDIEELCSRIVVMRQGSKVYDGQLSDLHDKFAQNKMINANLAEGVNADVIGSFPAELGILNIQDRKISICAPREKAMDAAKYLLNSTKILDLTIKEEDIGDIIEKIMHTENLL